MLGHGRMGRRGLGKRALVSAAGLAGLSFGLLPTVGRAAAPGSTGGKIHLVVGVPYQGASTFQGVPQQLVDDYIAKNWLPSHPGVTVTTISGMGCNGTCLGASDEIAATLAGQPADVIEGCCEEFVEFQAAQMLVPLDSYLQRDNIPLSGFSPGHLQTLKTPQGLLGLPQYDGPPPYMVNLGMLDDLGLKYPEPGWTYEDAERLWRATTGKRNGKQMSGLGVFSATYNWVTHAFGGSNSNADRTMWTIDSPEGTAAFKWFVPLVQEQVINFNWAEGVVQGQNAMGFLPSWELQYAVINARGMKWDLVPPPVFPSGKPSTYCNSDFNAMNAQTKNPLDVVWDMFKFITLDPGFARLQYQISLFTPNQESLWSDWFEIVRATVPSLRDKHLEYFQQAVSYGWPQVYMAYEGVQAKAIETNSFNEMFAHRIGVVEGLQQQTRQINALQSVGRTAQAEERKLLSAYQKMVKSTAAGHGSVVVASAPRTGSGSPSVAAAGLVHAAGGMLTVRGAGAGYLGSADGLTFACFQADKSEGTFTCRVTALAPAKGQSLVSGAKMGLMARGDLSDAAAAVALEVAVNRGVHFQDRAIPGANTSDTRPSSDSAATGLIGSQVLLVSSTKPAANYLLKPVWLRLDRSGGLWVPFTSWDGKVWTQAAPPTPVTVLGVWVGVFVTSHNPGHYVTAVFDSLSGGVPDTFVRIGAP